MIYYERAPIRSWENSSYFRYVALLAARLCGNIWNRIATIRQREKRSGISHFLRRQL